MKPYTRKELVSKMDCIFDEAPATKVLVRGHSAVMCTGYEAETKTTARRFKSLKNDLATNTNHTDQNTYQVPPCVLPNGYVHRRLV